MFNVRATAVTGAPDEVQGAFLLESKLDLVTTTEPVYIGRERGTGQRFWVKCEDGTAESRQRLASERQVLLAARHPHILQLLDEPRAAAETYLLYPWQAEQPLSTAVLDSLPAADRVRIAGDFLEVVQNLQTTDPPIAHRGLDMENLWASPLVHWVRLAGFNRAVSGAEEDVLAADRRDALKLLGQLVGPEESGSHAQDELRSAAEAWAEEPTGGYQALASAIRHVLLARITADL